MSVVTNTLEEHQKCLWYGIRLYRETIKKEVTLIHSEGMESILGQ
jgi:hypothetical protein